MSSDVVWSRQPPTTTVMSLQVTLLSVFISVIAACTTTSTVQRPQDSPATPVTTPAAPTTTMPGLLAPIDTPAPDATVINIPSEAVSYGDEIALRAISLVGKPYRYGGADLSGFDCSGMVYFIHQALGIEVPRTAADQQRAAMSVNRAALQPGDLLFFKTTRAARISHVGVYVGENRFVHAPQSGKLIELRNLDDQYYGKRLVSAGRLYPNS